MIDTIPVCAHTRQKPKKIPDPLQSAIDRRREERLNNKLVKAVETDPAEKSVIDKVLAWLEMWKP